MQQLSEHCPQLLAAACTNLCYHWATEFTTPGTRRATLKRRYYHPSLAAFTDCKHQWQTGALTFLQHLDDETYSRSPLADQCWGKFSSHTSICHEMLELIVKRENIPSRPSSKLLLGQKTYTNIVRWNKKLDMQLWSLARLCFTRTDKSDRCVHKEVNKPRQIQH